MDGALRVFGSQKQSNTKSVYGEQLHRWWRIDVCPHRFYISRFLFCIQELTDPPPPYPEGISYFRTLLGQTTKGQAVFSTAEPSMRAAQEATLDGRLRTWVPFTVH